MKQLIAFSLPGAVAGNAHAHVADAPLLQHALEHGWLVLIVLPLLLGLLPLGRTRRR